MNEIIDLRLKGERSCARKKIIDVEEVQNKMSLKKQLFKLSQR